MKNVIASLVALFSFFLVVSNHHIFGRSVLENMPYRSMDHSHMIDVTLLNDGITLQIANKTYTILFGSYRNEVEELLGEGATYAGIHKPFFFLKSRHYRTLGLTLHYHNEKLVYISLNQNEDKNNFLIHLDQWNFRLDQEYQTISDKLHTLADQVLPHQTFRFNHNYLSIHKNLKDALSVINYGDSFFDPFFQPDQQHIVKIQLLPEGLIIHNHEIHFGMSQAEVQAILGKANRGLIQFVLPDAMETVSDSRIRVLQQKHQLIYHQFASQLIFEEDRLVQWNHLIAQHAYEPVIPILYLYDPQNILIFNAMDFYHRPLTNLPIMTHSQAD